jgi:hypothetical protein
VEETSVANARAYVANLVSVKLSENNPSGTTSPSTAPTTATTAPATTTTKAP